MSDIALAIDELENNVDALKEDIELLNQRIDRIERIAQNNFDVVQKCFNLFINNYGKEGDF